MEVTQDCALAHAVGKPSVRRAFNQTFVSKLYIKGQDEVSADLTPALADVLGDAAALRAIEQAEEPNAANWGVHVNHRG